MNFSTLMITQLRVNDEYERERKKGYRDRFKKKTDVKTAILMQSRHVINMLGFWDLIRPRLVSLWRLSQIVVHA